MRTARAIAIVALGLAACRSSGGSKLAPVQAVQSRALPGLSVKLSEYVDGDVFEHADDTHHPTHAEKADVRSRLTLDFQAPKLTESGGVADPRWDALGKALEDVKVLADQFREVDEFVARTGDSPTPADVQAIRERVSAARDAQQAFFNGLVKANLMTMSEFTAKVIEIGRNRDADPFAVFADTFRSKREALHQQAAQLAAATEMLVTVRATLDPLVGDEQLLQVPGYYEKSAEDLHDDQTRARSAEMDRLRVEFDASQKVAAALHEIEAKNASIRGAARGALEKLGLRAGKLREFVDSVVGEKVKMLESVLAGAPSANANLGPAEQKLWSDLRRLRDDIQLIRSLPDALPDPSAEDPFAAVERFRGALAQIAQHLTGTDEIEGWSKVVERVVATLPVVARETADAELKPKLEQLATQVKADLDAIQQGLLARLPDTQAALDAIHATGVFSHSLGSLGDVGTEMPRPPGDLQPAKLDLRKNPVNDGDTLTLQVQVWQKAVYDLDANDRARQPAETITYSNELIRTGWRWSGDVIFTRPFSGPNDGHFEANAAVSREYHWYSRAEPDDWFNRLDPGVGFHAAQLNMDPDATTEFGVGINASLWDGLLRAGVGYNISVDDHQEYWFIGFGLISALDRLDDLRTKAFGGGD
jgi:hypothetical protein